MLYHYETYVGTVLAILYIVVAVDLDLSCGCILPLSMAGRIARIIRYSTNNTTTLCISMIRDNSWYTSWHKHPSEFKV